MAMPHGWFPECDGWLSGDPGAQETYIAAFGGKGALGWQRMLKWLRGKVLFTVIATLPKYSRDGFKINILFKKSYRLF